MTSIEELRNLAVKVDPPSSSFTETSMDDQNSMQGTFASRRNWYTVRRGDCLPITSKTCWNVTTSNELSMERSIGSKGFTNVGMVYMGMHDAIINIKYGIKEYVRGYQILIPTIR